MVQEDGRSWSRNRSEIGGIGAGYSIGKGASGGTGEDCGTVLIYDDFTVYSYGGAGGSGADGNLDNGSGGGGYPRSGNWRRPELGAAGGTCCTGGGGYSGGGGDCFTGTVNHTNYLNNRGAKGGKNGQSGERLYDSYAPLHSGGGYNVENIKDFSPYLFSQGLDTISGGYGGRYTSGGTHLGGCGGTAGNGGVIIVSDTAKVYAYNGNKYTDGTDYEFGKNQLEIYGQNGIVNKKWNITSAKFDEVVFTVESNAGTIQKSGYVNKLDSKIYGVGCGAGYYEKSNGIYKEVKNESIDETYKSLN